MAMGSVGRQAGEVWAAAHIRDGKQKGRWWQTRHHNVQSNAVGKGKFRSLNCGW